MRSVRALLALALLAGAAIGVGAPDAGADDIAEARARANRAAGELSRAQTQLAEIEEDVAAEEARLAEAEARLGALDTRLRDLAADLYVDSAGQSVGELFAGQDINQQLQREALTRLVTQRDFSAIEDFRALHEDATIAREALESSRAAQAGAVDQLRSRQRALDAELARLVEIERARQAELQRQRDAEARRRQTSRGGRAQSLAAPAGPIASGDWICPVQGPVAFVDSWGAPRSGGRRHQGVDMMSPSGTPTVAPVSGRVVHRGNSVGGLSWHLYGDDGHYYYGTHLSAYANEGVGHVQGGTVIGYVGDTGNARGSPHLHFEIHPNGGAAVNPYPTVARFC